MNSKDCTKLVVGLGYDINAVSADGTTPFLQFLEVGADDPNIAEAGVELGADPKVLVAGESWLEAAFRFKKHECANVSSTTRRARNE
jgi:ankyrin repeat protein